MKTYLSQKKGRPRKKRTAVTVESEDSSSPAKKLTIASFVHLEHSYADQEAQIESPEATHLYQFTVEWEDVSHRTSVRLHDNTDICANIDIETDYFDELHANIKESVRTPYHVIRNGDAIKIVEMYDFAMKLCIVIKKSLTVDVYVHNRLVPRDNIIYDKITNGHVDIDSVKLLLRKLSSSHVCVGNTEPEFVAHFPTGSGLNVAGEGSVDTYLEHDFGAKFGMETYIASVRSISCQLLLFSRGIRCIHCGRARTIMQNRGYRKRDRELKPKKSLLYSKTAHAHMDRNELCLKLDEQKNVIKDLQKEVELLNCRELTQRQEIMELPANNADYREQWYWDKRFETEEKYDWFSGYTSFKHLLKKDVKTTSKILTLGCGNSALSEDMYHDGYTHITNTDFSPVVIEKMSEKHRDLTDMTWTVMDACDLQYEPESFDIVLEKGMLDALMVHEKDPWYGSDETCEKIDLILTQISQILKPGGKFISITFAQPHFRRPLYARTKYKWNVNLSTFGGSFSFFYFMMEKGRELSEKDKNMEIEHRDKRLNRDSKLKSQVFLDSEENEDFMLGMDL